MLVGPRRAADTSRQALWVMEPASGHPDNSLEDKVNESEPQERLELLFPTEPVRRGLEDTRGRLGASENRPAIGRRGDYPGVQLQMPG